MSRSTVVIATVVVTRLLVLGAGVLAVHILPLTGDPYRDSNLEAAKLAPLVTLNERWDAGWYAQIALDGYEWDAERDRTLQQAVAFFPGFPLTIRGILFVTDRIPFNHNLRVHLGRNPIAQAVTVGTFVALAAFTIALVLLHQLAGLDLERSGANRSVICCGVYPFAIFFSAPYTESLYLMAVVGAFLAQRRGRLFQMFAFGLLAGLTRQTGFLLVFALMVGAVISTASLANRKWHFRSVAAAASPIVGMLVYSGYLWSRFGAPLAWVQAQKAWSPTDRWTHMLNSGSITEYLGSYPHEAVNLVAILLVLPVIWTSRRLQWSYFVFGLTSVAVPLIVDVAPLGRLTSVIFPVFIALGAAHVRRRAFLTLSLLSLILELVIATQFYGWRRLY